jgi:ribonuclease BN (tRNA processing enzyme)
MIRDSKYRKYRLAPNSKRTIILYISIVISLISYPIFSDSVIQNSNNKVLADCIERTHIVLLGTGTPNPEPNKHGPAIAIVIGKTAYLVDCGPGIVRRAAAAYDAGMDALEASNLDTVFITHLHSDHTLGYPDLIITPWIMGRTIPLRAFGPKGLKHMTDHILEAYNEDIKVRVNGIQPTNKTGYKVDIHEINPGIIFKDNKIEARAFPVKHGDWKIAFGFRFITPDMDICISGDTTVYAGMEENYKNCDVLIHEVYSEMGFQKRPPEWQKYHKASHTSAVELGAIANKVNPGILVLIHQLLWGYNEQEVLEEIALNYNGEVVFGRDLYLIGIPKNYKSKRSGEKSSEKFILIDLMSKLDYNF